VSHIHQSGSNKATHSKPSRSRHDQSQVATRRPITVIASACMRSASVVRAATGRPKCSAVQSITIKQQIQVQNNIKSVLHTYRHVQHTWRIVNVQPTDNKTNYATNGVTATTTTSHATQQATVATHTSVTPSNNTWPNKPQQQRAARATATTCGPTSNQATSTTRHVEQRSHNVFSHLVNTFHTGTSVFNSIAVILYRL